LQALMLLIESPFVGSTPTLTALKSFKNEGFFFDSNFYFTYIF
jgi:hypothetical protein